MIQRIQSLYLLIATILLTVMIFTPIATVPMVDSEIVIKPFLVGQDITQSFAQVAGISYLSILLLAAVVLSFFAIFCYRHRMFQAKIVILSCVLMAGLQIFVIYSLYNATKFTQQMIEQGSAGIIDITYSFTGLFPLIAAILSYLAFRGVVKDEMLIKSLDRLR